MSATPSLTARLTARPTPVEATAPWAELRLARRTGDPRMATVPCLRTVRREAR